MEAEPRRTEAGGRAVVLHADDFGMNRAVTDGIVRGFAEGLLTSTSLLANGTDAGRAVQLWQQLEQDRRAGALPSLPTRRQLGDGERPFDLGIHLNLTEGRPLTASRYPSALLDRQGRFPGIFGLFRRLWRHGAEFQQAIEEELSQQVQSLLDHGIQLTHINGHQYVEMIPVVTEVVVRMLEKFQVGVVRVAIEPGRFRSPQRGLAGLPGRLFSQVHHVYARRFCARIQRMPVSYPDAYFGVGRAGHIELDYMRAALGASRMSRLIEFGMHPAQAAVFAQAHGAADAWPDALASRRPEELRLLLCPDLADFLESEHLRLGRLADPPTWRTRLVCDPIHAPHAGRVHYEGPARIAGK